MRAGLILSLLGSVLLLATSGIHAIPVFNKGKEQKGLGLGAKRKRSVLFTRFWTLHMKNNSE